MGMRFVHFFLTVTSFTSWLLVNGNVGDDGSCPLFTLLPFTSRHSIPDDVAVNEANQYNIWSSSNAARIATSLAATTLMAMDHWNTRNTVIVPELVDVDPLCTVFFPDVAFVDSEADGASAVRSLWETGSSDRLPCAVLAPLQDQSVMDIIPVLKTLRIPLINYFTANDKLAEHSDDPLIVVNELNALGRAQAMIQFLESRKFLALWQYEGSAQNLELVEKLQSVGKESSVDVQVFNSKIPDDVSSSEHVRASFRSVKESGITTIFLSPLITAQMPLIARVLSDLGMLSSKYVYIVSSDVFLGNADPSVFWQQVPDSPLDKLLRGSLVFDRIDAVGSGEETNTFTASWQNHDDDFLKRLNTLIPTSWLKATPQFFNSSKPVPGASYLYDAIMTIGFGGCLQQRNERLHPPTVAPTTFVGTIEEAHENDTQPQSHNGFTSATDDLNSQQSSETPPEGFALPKGFVVIPVEKQENLIPTLPPIAITEKVRAETKELSNEPIPNVTSNVVINPNNDPMNIGPSTANNGSKNPANVEGNVPTTPNSIILPPNQRPSFVSSSPYYLNNVPGLPLENGGAPMIPDVSLTNGEQHSVVLPTTFGEQNIPGLPSVSLAQSKPTPNGQQLPSTKNDARLLHIPLTSDSKPTISMPNLVAPTLSVFPPDLNLPSPPPIQDSVSSPIQNKKTSNSNSMPFQGSNQVVPVLLPTKNSKTTNSKPSPVAIQNAPDPPSIQNNQPTVSRLNYLDLPTVQDSELNPLPTLVSTNQSSKESSMHPLSPMITMSPLIPMPFFNLSSTPNVQGLPPLNAPSFSTFIPTMASSSSNTPLIISKGNPRAKRSKPNNVPSMLIVPSTISTDNIARRLNLKNQSTLFAESLGANTSVRKNSKMPSFHSGQRRLYSSSTSWFQENSLIENMVLSNFQGASGNVSFGQEQRFGRNFDGINVGLFNIQEGGRHNATKLRSYKSVMISTWSKANGWVDTQGQSIVSRDGSNLLPKIIRWPLENNYILGEVRVLGLVLMSLAWFLALGCMIGLVWLRNDKIVKQTHPTFMFALCFGSILVSASIFTVSWDEGDGWTASELSFSCTLTPWFFFIGQITMLCALVTNLWKGSVLLDNRNRVGLILATVFSCSTIALLLAWTIVDPWTWERHDIDGSIVESYGICNGEYSEFFYGPLIGIEIAVESISIYFAWKTDDGKEDCHHKTNVMHAFLAQLEARAIGIPMLAVIGTSNSTAAYFARVFVIWIMAVASILMIVCPVIYKAIQLRIKPELKVANNRVKVSSVYDSSCGDSVDNSSSATGRGRVLSE